MQTAKIGTPFSFGSKTKTMFKAEDITQTPTLMQSAQPAVTTDSVIPKWSTNSNISGLFQQGYTTNATTAWNSSTTEDDESELRRYLAQLSQDTANTLLPVLLVLACVMLVGICSNLLVLYIYARKFSPCAARTTILALASLDLITSALSVPGEMLDLSFAYSFRNAAACKISRMVTTFCLVASGIVLVSVAFDRYRNICHPLGSQLTALDTWRRVLLSGAVALLGSIPAAVVYGIAVVPTPRDGVYGQECSTSQEFKGHPLPIVYNAVLFAIFVTALGIISVLYILIGRVVLRQTNYRNRVRRATDPGTPSYSNVEEGAASISDGNREGADKEAEMCLAEEPSHQSQIQPASPTSINKPKRTGSIFRRRRKVSTSRDVRMRKTTLMLFLITLVFVLSYLPHLILKAVSALNKNFTAGLDGVALIFYNIFVRSYFFSVVSNSFIYGFCSPKFRTQVKVLVLRLAFWVKKARRLSIQDDDIM